MGKKHQLSTFIHFSTATVAGLFLFTLPATATEPTASDYANASVTVAEACTMSGTGMSSHTAEVPNGTYQSNIGTSTMKAYCNDSEGFAIYATGYTGNEIGATNSNKLVGTVASGNATIDTGTATSAGNPDVSNWAMKLATITSPTPTYPIILAGSTSDTEKEQGDPDFSNYTAVPNTYTKVAYRTAGTDIGTNAEGATLTTTYAAYISKTQPADTYTGQVIYTLVHPSSADAPFVPHEIECEAGKICYNTNAGVTETVGTMGRQSIPASATSATLLASNFSREGYGFAGWSNKYDYATNPNQEGIKFYGPQETITFTAGQYTGDNNGLALYAVWVKTAGRFQDSTKVAELCGSGQGSLTIAPTDGTANLTSVSALTDQRDNNTYAIAKLADGKCWMIENLRLESTAAHNSDGKLAQGYNSSFVGLANAESANFDNDTTANSLYSTDGSTDKTIDSTGGNLGYRFPRYNNLNTQSRASNPTSGTFSGDSITGGMYSYGNYYTWHAAIADTTHYSSGDYGTTSLCPTGWRLPIGNQSTSSNSFGALSVALGGPEGGATADNYYSTPTGAVMSKTFRSYPNNFLYSGNFYASSATSRGSSGRYLSSTLSNDYGSYNLYLDGSYVFPGTSTNNKGYGLSIRCTLSAGT